VSWRTTTLFVSCWGKQLFHFWCVTI
jgi:hypothetical protein